MLQYRYQPGTSPESPLLILIHGRAGNLGVMWPFSSSAVAGCAIVSFQAPLPDPEKGGFSWWLLPTEDPLAIVAEKSAALLEESVQQFVVQEQLSPQELQAVGFSQGGMVLSLVAQRGVLEVRRVALLASLVVERKTEALPFKKPAILVAHGTEDEVIEVKKARQGRDYLRGCGFEVGYVEDPVGHKIGSQGARRLREFLRAEDPHVLLTGWEMGAD